MPQPLDLKKCVPYHPHQVSPSLSRGLGGGGGAVCVWGGWRGPADATSAASPRGLQALPAGPSGVPLLPSVPLSQRHSKLGTSCSLWETAEIMSTNNSSEGKSVQERPKTTPHLERLEGLEEPASLIQPLPGPPAALLASLILPCTAQPAWSYSSKTGLTSRCLCLESKPYQVHRTNFFLLLKAFPIPAGIPSPQELP